MIYTSYFGNIKNLPSLTVPVSIARWTPKWFIGLELIEFAPSISLLNWWKSSDKIEMDKEIYINKFREELKQKDIWAILDKLMKLSGPYDPVLLCYEQPDEFCHRHLIRKMLNHNGIECKEV